jgi:amidophosphoribosyltransferase
VLGRLDRGWVVAARPRRSTSSAPASCARSSRASCSPSTSTACAAQRFAEKTPKGCLFEYVYLARPDTTIAGQGVYTTRVQVGRTLAFEAPVDADLVIPVPESGTPAAIGFAEQSGIPYGRGW